MDTGEVCSVESGGYVFNHTDRGNIYPTITEEQAKEVLNVNIQIENVLLTLIPSETNNEILTYEFRGKINEREFLVYVNAKTKEEENVLLILNTEGGKLTM